jgi:hypothetical protein
MLTHGSRFNGSRLWRVESADGGSSPGSSREPYWREQLHRRQGGGGQPNQSQDRSTPGIHSSEKERAKPSDRKQHSKGSKLDRIRIDREEVLKFHRLSLPPDAQFKRYEEVVVQELRIDTDHMKFRKEKFWGGLYGPNLLGAAARWLPRRIRSPSEEPAVFSSVPQD